MKYRQGAGSNREDRFLGADLQEPLLQAAWELGTALSHESAMRMTQGLGDGTARQIQHDLAPGRAAGPGFDALAQL
ncbi:MAG: hypothetical protein EOP12_04695 [Pseudomonas sp.]|nr:MAG: hypothetical protein EOP12_04695 [Pseudomonas sp.]